MKSRRRQEAGDRQDTQATLQAERRVSPMTTGNAQRRADQGDVLQLQSAGTHQSLLPTETKSQGKGNTGGPRGANPPGMSQHVAPQSRRGKRQGEKPHTANDVEGRGFSKRLNLTAWVRAFNCNSVYVLHFHSMKVLISVRTSYNKADLRCLVDSGTTDNFIHPRFV